MSVKEYDIVKRLESLSEELGFIVSRHNQYLVLANTNGLHAPFEDVKDAVNFLYGYRAGLGYGKSKKV